MKLLNVILILFVLALAVGCTPGDIDDTVYFRQIGDSTDAGKVDVGYFHELYVDGDTLYIGGVAVDGNGGEGGGAAWFSGDGTPSESVGSSGDYYLDNLSGDYYEKLNTKSMFNWTLQGNLKGAQGLQGLQGIQGIPGIKGDTGEKANTGDTGLQGIPGTPGVKGDTGDTGSTGPKGDTGSAGPNTVTTSTTTNGTGFVKGNGSTITFDNSTYATLGYTLQAHPASQSTTTDSQTMYWGGFPVAPSTTADRWRIYIPKTGTITAVYIYSYSGTAGSNENWSMYIRYDNTSDTLVQTLGANTNDRTWSNTGLNISVVQGHYIEIKEIQPAWGTNPATVTRTAVIYIRG